MNRTVLRARTSPLLKAVSTFVSAMLLFGPAGFAGNLPSGPSIVHGNVAIDVQGQAMNIAQGSDRAVINWESFSIGQGYGVYVDQPSAQAAMLARVVGSDPSRILGALQANGIFYLVNPNGVYFGPNATVDVAQLIATTLNLTDQDFLAGNLNFTGDSTASVVNDGTIRADMAALLARNVTNAGTITAREAVLAAASNVELGRIAGGKLSVDMSGLLGDVINTGTVDASGSAANPDGGQVVMTGGRAAQIGTVQADGIDAGDGGDVFVFGQDALVVAGTTTARGGDSGGDGGFIETSTHGNLAINTAPDAGATNGTAGTWLIDPLNLTIGIGLDATVSPATPFAPLAPGANLDVDTLLAALATADVIIDTQGAGAENGDVTFLYDVRQNVADGNYTGLFYAYSQYDLTVNAAGSIIIADGNLVPSQVGALPGNPVTISIGGAITLNADVDGDSGAIAQNLTMAAILGPLSYRDGIYVGGHITGDGVAFGGGAGVVTALGGSLSAQVQSTDGADLDTDAAPITFNTSVTSTGINHGFSIINQTGTGDVSDVVFNYDVEGPAGLNVQTTPGSAGDVFFNSAVGSLFPLDSLVVHAGETYLGSSVNVGTGGLTITGSGNTTTITNDITSLGNVVFNDNVVLDSPNAVWIYTDTNNTDVTFNGTVDADTAGDASLRLVAGSGDVTFGDDVGGSATLGRLMVDTAGTVFLGGNITTSAGYYAGTVDLAGASQIVLTDNVAIWSAQNANLQTAIDGNYDLAITAEDRVRLGPVGQNAIVRSLDVAAQDRIELNGSITTVNDTTLAHAPITVVELTDNIAILSYLGDVALSGVVQSSSGNLYTLDVTAEDGNVTLGQIGQGHDMPAMGNVPPLARMGAVTVASVGTTTLLGDIFTDNAVVDFTGAREVILGTDVVINTTNNRINGADGADIRFSSGAVINNTLGGGHELWLDAGTGNITADNIVELTALTIDDYETGAVDDVFTGAQDVTYDLLAIPGSLHIDAGGTVSGGNTIIDDDIVVSAARIIVEDAMVVSGVHSIDLTATGVGIPDEDGDIILMEMVMSQAGDIALRADDDIVFAANGQIRTTGAVSLTAGADGETDRSIYELAADAPGVRRYDAGDTTVDLLAADPDVVKIVAGTLTMGVSNEGFIGRGLHADEAVATATEGRLDINVEDDVNATAPGEGGIRLHALGDLWLGTIDADAGIADLGARFAINDFDNNVDDITGSEIFLTAGTGIGNIDPIDLVTSSINAQTSGGDVRITNAAAAWTTINTLKTGIGTIDFEQTGGQNLILADNSTGAVRGDVVIDNDATISLGTNAISAPEGEAQITATGQDAAITGISTADLLPEITAADIQLDAPGGIEADIRTTGSTVWAFSLVGNVELWNTTDFDTTFDGETQGAGATLKFHQSAFTPGADAGTLEVLSARTSSGDIVIDVTQGNLVAYDVRAGTAAAADGTITLATIGSGNLSLGNVTALADNVAIGAGVTGTALPLALAPAGSGQIIDMNNAEANVVAENLALVGADGIDTDIEITGALRALTDDGVIDLYAYASQDPADADLDVINIDAGAAQVFLRTDGTLDLTQGQIVSSTRVTLAADGDILGNQDDNADIVGGNDNAELVIEDVSVLSSLDADVGHVWVYQAESVENLMFLRSIDAHEINSDRLVDLKTQGDLMEIGEIRAGSTITLRGLTDGAGNHLTTLQQLSDNNTDSLILGNRLEITDFLTVDLTTDVDELEVAGVGNPLSPIDEFIRISNQGDLLLDGVFAYIQASVDITASGDLTVHEKIQTSAADQFVSLTSTGGSIVVREKDGEEIETVGGSSTVTLNAADDIELWTGIDVTSTGTVKLHAGGFITDPTDGDMQPLALDPTQTREITAETLTISAAAGIGASNPAAPGVWNTNPYALNTNIERLIIQGASGQPGASGEAYILERDGLPHLLANVEGDLNILTLAGDIGIGTDELATVTSSDGSVALTAAGAITVDSVNAVLGRVRLEAQDGDILDRTSGAPTITGSDLDFVASGTVGTAGNALDTQTLGSSIVAMGTNYYGVNTTAVTTSLDAQVNGTPGVIEFAQSGGGDLEVLRATTADGHIIITNDAADMAALEVRAGGAGTGDGTVVLATGAAGDITLGVVTALDDDVLIAAGANLATLAGPTPALDVTGFGRIIDANGVTPNILGKDLNILAPDGIDTDIELTGTLRALTDDGVIDLYAYASQDPADADLDVINIDAGSAQVFLRTDGTLDLTQGQIVSSTRVTLAADADILGNQDDNADIVGGNDNAELVIEDVSVLSSLDADVGHVWVYQAESVENLMFLRSIDVHEINSDRLVDLKTQGDLMEIGEIRAGSTITLRGLTDGAGNHLTTLQQLSDNNTDSLILGNRLEITDFLTVDLTTDVDELEVAGVGNPLSPIDEFILISNQGDLLLDGVFAYIQASVDITASGDLTVREKIQTQADGQFVALTSTGGSIVVQEKDGEEIETVGGTATVTLNAADDIELWTGIDVTSTGTVNLRAGGFITDPTDGDIQPLALDPTQTREITAETLTISAAAGIGASDPAQPGVWNANPYALDTNIERLIIQGTSGEPGASGEAYILERDGLPHLVADTEGDLNVATMAGDIGLGADQIVTITSSNGNVVLTAAENVTIDLIHTGYGSVTLEALNGNVLDRDSDGPNVIASDITLLADDGSVGDPANWFDTQTTGSSLTAIATGDGNGITINNLALANADTTLTASTDGYDAPIMVTQTGGGDLDVIDAATVDGNIVIEVRNGGDLIGSLIEANEAGEVTGDAGADPIDGNVTLTTLDGGDILLGSVVAQNTATINSSGQVYSITGDLNIEAATVDINAQTNVIDVMIRQSGDNDDALVADGVSIDTVNGTIDGVSITAEDAVTLNANRGPGGSGSDGMITETMVTTTGATGDIVANAQSGFHGGFLTAEAATVLARAYTGDVVELNTSAYGLDKVIAFDGSIVSGSATSTAGQVKLLAYSTEPDNAITRGNILNTVVHSFGDALLLAEGEIIGTIANVDDQDIFLIAPTVSGGEYVTAGNVVIKSYSDIAGEGDVVGISVDAGGSVFVDTGVGGDVEGSMIDAGGNVAIGVAIAYSVADPENPVITFDPTLYDNPADPAEVAAFFALAQGEAMNIIDVGINAGGNVLLYALEEIDGTDVTAVDDIDANAGTGIVSTTLVSTTGSVAASTLLGNIVDSTFVTKGAGGTVTLEALAATGELDGNEVVSVSDVTVTAGSFIIDGMYVSETGSVTLTSQNQSIIGTDVVSKMSYAELNAAQFINDADVTAADYVALNADLDVTNTSVLAGSNVTVDGWNNTQVRSVHATDITAGGWVTVDASEELDNSTIAALGYVTVNANNVTNSNVDADGKLTITALEDITNSIFKTDSALVAELTAGESIMNADLVAEYAAAILIAQTGDIDGGSVRALDVREQAGRSIANGSVTALDGNADLDAIAGFIDDMDVTAMSLTDPLLGNVTLDAELDVVNTSVAATGTILVGQTSNLNSVEISQFAAGGLVDIDADYDVHGSEVSSGSTVDVTAGSDIDTTDIVAVGAVTLEAGDMITDTDVTSTTGAILFTADTNADLIGSIIGGSATAEASSVTLNAAQFISDIDVNAWTDVGLNADLDVVNTSVLAGGNVAVNGFRNALTRSVHATDITAGGWVTIDASEELDNSTIAALGYVTVNANNVTNSNVDADGLIDVNALTNITNSVFKGDLAGVLAVDLEAGEAIRNVDVLATNGSARLNAIASEIDATDVQALLDIEADAGTYIVASSFIAEEGSIDIEAHDGNIVATSVVLKDEDGSADEEVRVVASAELDAVWVDAMAPVVATAGTFIIDGMYVSETDDVTLWAQAGSIDATTAVAKLGHVTAIADQNLSGDYGNIVDLVVDAYLTATVTAETDISGGTVAALGNATLTASTGEINGTTVQTDATATLWAAQDMTGTSVDATTALLTAGWDMTGNAVDAVLAAVLSATLDVTGNEVDALTIQIAATADNVVGNALTSGTWIDIDAEQDVTGNSLDAATWVTINTAQNAAGNQITALETVAITTTLDATGNLIDAGGTVTITATADAAGNVIDTGANAFVTGANVQGGSVNAVGTADLTATVGNVDGIVVLAGGAVTALAEQSVTGASFTSTGDLVSVMATQGSVTATDVNAFDTATVWANIDIVDGSVTAIDNATLTASTGEINGTTVQTDATATLWAAQDMTGTSVDATTALLTAGWDMTGNAVDAVLAAVLNATLDVTGNEVDALSIQIAATADNVVGNALTSGTWIDIDAEQDVTGNSLDAATWVTINTAQNAAGNQITALETVEITTTLDATGNLIDAGGAVTLTTGLDATGNVIDADSAWLNAGQDIVGGSVSVAGLADLDAVADIVGTTVDAGNATLDAVQIAGVQVNTDTTAVLTATDSVQGGSVNAGTTATITATNDIDGLAAMANGLVTLTATDGSITASSATSDTAAAVLTAGTEIDGTAVTAWLDITATAGQAISASSFTSETGNLDIEATLGDIIGSVLYAKVGVAELRAGDEIDATDVTAGQSIFATAGTFIVASSFTAENGSIDIEATNGNIVDTTVVLKDNDDSADDLVLIRAGGELDAVWVDAAADIDAAGTHIISGMYLSETGNVDLVSTAGNIDATTATAKVGYVSATANSDGAGDYGNIIGMTVDAFTTATLLAAQDITGGTVASLSTAMLTATAGEINGTAVQTNGLADLNALLDITGVTVDAGQITADGANLSGGAYTAATTIALNATADITGAILDAGTAATLIAAEDITGVEVDAATTTWTAAGDISGGTAGVSGTADFMAGSDIVGIAVNAGGAVTMTADANTAADADSDGYIQGVTILTGATADLIANENIDASAVTAQGQITIQAGQDVTASDLVSVLAGVDYTVYGDVIGGSASTAADINLNVDGGITNLQATTGGGDTITIAGASGAAAGTVDGGVFTADTIDFTVAQGVGADNAVVLAGAEWIDIANTVAGGINAINTNNNDTSITATSAGIGDIAFDQRGIGHLTVAAMSAAEGDIVVSADDDITTLAVTTAAMLADAGDIRILARDGDLTVAGSGIAAVGSDAEVVLTAVGEDEEVTIDAVVTTQSGNITITAGDDANLNANITVLSGGHAVSVTAGDDIGLAVGATVTDLGGIITLNAFEDIELDGSLWAAAAGSTDPDAGTVVLTAGEAIRDDTGAAQGIRAGTLSIMGAMLVGSDAGDLPLPGVTSDTGWLDTDVAQLNVSNVTGSAFILELNDIELGSVSADLTYDEHFALHARNIALGDVAAQDGLVTLIASGAIDDDLGDADENAANFAIDLTARSLYLSAQNGIGATRPIELSAQSILRAVTATNDIVMTNVSDVDTVVGDLAVTSVSGTGDITFDQAGAGDVTFEDVSTPDGDIRLSTDASDLTVVQVETLSGDIAAVSGDDLFVRQTVNAADGDVTLSAERNLVLEGESLVTASDIAMLFSGADTLMGGESQVIADVVVTAAEGDLRMGIASLVWGRSEVDITAANAALELVQAGTGTAFTGGMVSITATEGGITVNTDDAAADIVADEVALEAINGIGHNPIVGGVKASIDIAYAEVVDAITTGDNGIIDLDLANTGAEVTIEAHTLGEDADIILDNTGSPLTMAYVATQNGDIVVTSNRAVDMVHVWALDDGVINPDDPNDLRPSSNGSGISSLPDNNGITGVVDDAHYVDVTVTGPGDVTLHDVWADYYLVVDVEGPGDVAVATDGVTTCDVLIVVADGSIIDIENTDAIDIRACGSITLWVGGQIGEPWDGDPLDVEAAGRVNVGAVDGAPLFGNNGDLIWAFLRGTSGDGGIHYLGGPSGTPPGLIIWNGAAWGGPETPMRRIDAAEGGWTRETTAMIERYQNRVWDFQFLYFPHVWAMLDKVPAIFNIEYILHGGGTIEGLPEGVAPTEINMNDLDDTFSYTY